MEINKFPRSAGGNHQPGALVSKLRRFCLFGFFFILCTAAMGTHPASSEHALILYDSAPPYEHVGRFHAALLENLLGHFEIDVVKKPVTAYQTGEIDAARAAFYLGAIFNEPSNYAPDSEQLANYNLFLKDAAQTSGTLVWLNYNLWYLADYMQKNGSGTAEKFGFTVKGMVNEGYNRITYKGTELYKGVVPHANPGANLTGCIEEGDGRWSCVPELNYIQVVDPAKATIYAEAYSTHRPDAGKAPYISRFDNFWVVGDIPSVHFSEEDRYLALADLLHEMLAIPHEEKHLALIRLEDVSTRSGEDDFAAISEYLAETRIPFAVSTIALDVDGAGTQRQISQSPVGRYMANAISGSLPGSSNDLQPNIAIIAHGYTHQSEYPQNPYDGESGSDFEFYQVTSNPDNSLNYVGPVASDVGEWAYQRMLGAKNALSAGGLPSFAWSAPHYLASANAYSEIQKVFPIHYGRMTYFIERGNGYELLGQFFPYPIHRDLFGYHIIPESIGYFEPKPVSGYRPLFPDDMIRHAKKQLVVRDGYASFFYHPSKGVTTLKEIVEGIQALGYEFVSPKSIFPSITTTEIDSEGPSADDGSSGSGGSGCFLSTMD